MLNNLVVQIIVLSLYQQTNKNDMRKGDFKVGTVEYKGFVIIENISELIDFTHETTNGLMKSSATTLVKRAQARDRKEMVGHATDVITHTVERTNEIIPKGIIYKQAELMGSYATHLEKCILDGKRLAINPFNLVSYFTIPDDVEVTIISDKEVYTEEDIKISRWDGGAHWYAKIRNIDVVIEGEMKWNYRLKAEKMAKQFLKELNS